MISIQQLQEGGGFVSDVPAKKHIKWKIGKKAFEGDIFVRRLGIEEWERYFIGNDATARKRVTATSLAAIIRLGEDGAEEMTVDQAASLHPALATAMAAAAREVHDPKESSPTETDS